MKNLLIFVNPSVASGGGCAVRFWRRGKPVLRFRALKCALSKSNLMNVCRLLFIFALLLVSLHALARNAPGQKPVKVHVLSTVDSENRLVQVVGQAQRSVWLIGDSMLSPKLAHALLDAKSRKIDVRMIVDAGNASDDATLKRLLDAGILTRPIANTQGASSGAYLLADEATVIGLYAEEWPQKKLTERRLWVFMNSPELALQYRTLWTARWNASREERDAEAVYGGLRNDPLCAPGIGDGLDYLPVDLRALFVCTKKKVHPE